MYEDDNNPTMDTSHKSTRSKSSANTDTPDYEQSASDPYTQSHPPYSSPLNDSYTEKLSRRSSNDPGRRKKLKYESQNQSNNACEESLMRSFITNNSIANSTATKKASNSTGGGSGSFHKPRVDYPAETQQTTGASTGTAAVIDSTKTEKTSSLSSSSTGSRRRQKERERQRARVGGGVQDFDGSEREVDRITPIMEVGGDNFVQEFESQQANNNSQSQGSTSVAQHSVAQHLIGEPPQYSSSRGGDRSYHSRGTRRRGDHVRDSRPSHPNDAIDWPLAPPDQFMDDATPPPAAQHPQHHQQHSMHIDDVQSAQSQMHQQAQQQQQQPPPPAGKRAVLHACDDKGRCLFHPHIILRKKALLGMGGWKDVLPACPECENEDMGGGGEIGAITTRQVKFDGGGGPIDGSGSSRELEISRVSRRSSAKDQDTEESAGESSDDDDDSSSSSGSSSSSTDSGSGSGSTSSGGSSSSSSDEQDEPITRQQSGGSASDRLPPLPRDINNSKAAKAFAGKARKINKLAAGAGNKIKKKWDAVTHQRDEDLITDYISSGVPALEAARQQQQQQHTRGKQSRSMHRPEGGPPPRKPSGAGGPLPRSRRSASDSDEIPQTRSRRTSESDDYPQTLSPNESMESQHTPLQPQQQGKKIMKGVSKGVTGLIKKSRKKLANSAHNFAQTPRTNSGEFPDNEDYDNHVLTHSDQEGDYDVGAGVDLYGSDNYFDRYVGDSRHNRRRRSRERQVHPHHRSNNVLPGEYHHRPDNFLPGESQHPRQNKHRNNERRNQDIRDNERRPRPRPRRDPSGKSLHVDGLKSRSENNGATSSKGSRGSRKSSMDSGASFASSYGHPAPPSTNMEEEDEEFAIGTTLPYNNDIAYQWDRVPMPEPSHTRNSTGPKGGGDGSVPEEDPHGERLAGVAYQWDRMPLPMETDDPSQKEDRESDDEDDSKDSSNDDDSSDDDEEESQSDYQQIRQEQRKQEQWDYAKRQYYKRRSMEELERNKEMKPKGQTQKPTSRDESRSPSPPSVQGTGLDVSSKGTGNLDAESVLGMEEEVRNVRQASAHSIASSVEESHVSGGVLSMEDLLHSIQKDISLPIVRRNSAVMRENSASMPQLDRSGTSSSADHEEMSSSYMELSRKNAVPLVVKEEPESRMKEDEKSISAISGLHLAEDDKSDNEESSNDKSSTWGSERAEPLQDVKPPPASKSPPTEFKPQVLPLMGNYGGLKIDLSSLTASKPVAGSSKPAAKPETNNDDDASSGGLKIDLSSLQASKPDVRNQPEEKEELFDPSVKTFETTNLPYTGEFGESGMYTGPVSGQYEPHGKGVMVYDNGDILKGYWNAGELVRESDLYSDSEDDDEEEEEEDLNSSMINMDSKVKGKYSGSREGGDRSRSRSRSRSISRNQQEAPSPPPLKYIIGDSGKHRDMILDKEEAFILIEQLKFGDGAFIRRSDGKWSYAIVKSLEETEEGKSAIRFLVNDRNSSKSYAKKYWGTHVRPLKGTKIKPPPEPEQVTDEREGRTKQREDLSNTVVTSDSEIVDRSTSCPPTQSRLSFEWGMGPPARRGRSRSHSRRRCVSFSRERGLHAIEETDLEDEEEDENDDDPKGGLGVFAARRQHELSKHVSIYYTLS